MDAGVAYSIFQNKGSLKLAASDIFNTHYNMYHTNYANLDITERDKLGSRFVTATFTYRFGTSSFRRRNNNIDEQKRLGGSSNENWSNRLAYPAGEHTDQDDEQYQQSNKSV